VAQQVLEDSSLTLTKQKLERSGFLRLEKGRENAAEITAQNRFNFWCL